jgi:hypothetical protein
MGRPYQRPFGNFTGHLALHSTVHHRCYFTAIPGATPGALQEPPEDSASKDRDEDEQPMAGIQRLLKLAQLCHEYCGVFVHWSPLEAH